MYEQQQYNSTGEGTCKACRACGWIAEQHDRVTCRTCGGRDWGPSGSRKELAAYKLVRREIGEFAYLTAVAARTLPIGYEDPMAHWLVTQGLVPATAPAGVDVAEVRLVDLYARNGVLVSEEAVQLRSDLFDRVFMGSNSFQELTLTPFVTPSVVIMLSARSREETSETVRRIVAATAS